jgi:hypothetical protein
MPNSVSIRSVYGCGTRYYGERYFEPDGSYVTTKFFCILLFPLIPIHSVRVIPDPKNKEWFLEGESYYLVLEKRAPNLRQVVSVYLCELAVVALIGLYFIRIEPFLEKHAPWFASRWLGFIAMSITIAPVFIMVRLLRMRARKRAEANDLYRPIPIA